MWIFHNGVGVACSSGVCVHGVDLSGDIGAAVGVLKAKLVWATSQLRATSSVHEAQAISELINSTCKAIAALRDL